MTKLMERMLDTARHLSPEMQDDIARMALSFIGEDEDFFELTPDDIEAVRLSREAVARGEIATDEEVQALWAKYGR